MGLTYNGQDLELNWGIHVDSSQSWVKPERDREFIHVPGRSGDLILDRGSWQNVEIEYNCHIDREFASNYEAFVAWLSTIRGYEMLFDDFHPDVYRLAAPEIGELEPETLVTDQAANFTLVFNCKPQQFINDGINHDVELDFTSGDAMADIEDPESAQTIGDDPEDPGMEDDMDAMDEEPAEEEPADDEPSPYLADPSWEGSPLVTVFAPGGAKFCISNDEGEWWFAISAFSADRIVIDFETGNAVLQDEMGEFVSNGNSYLTVTPPSVYAADFPQSKGYITAYHLDPDDEVTTYTGTLTLDPRWFRI